MSPRNTHVLGAGAQGKLEAAVQLAAYIMDLPAKMACHRADW